MIVFPLARSGVPDLDGLPPPPRDHERCMAAQIYPPRHRGTRDASPLSQLSPAQGSGMPRRSYLRCGAPSSGARPYLSPPCSSNTFVAQPIVKPTGA